MLAALVGALLLSGGAVASASASEFVFSKTGTLAGHGWQEFTTAMGAYECSESTISGKVTTLKSSTLKATVQYGGCDAFGLPMEFTPAEYEFSTAGTVKLLKPVIVEVGFGSCTVKFPAQTLGSIAYNNKSGGKLEIEPSITGIESSASGTCGYKTEKSGVETGYWLVELTGGGTVEVK
ncbi:MAG TPA: hypothetical protein VGF95_15475 [Solirubrobacteraceae bacterium]|jgi:hypothetical protein